MKGFPLLALAVVASIAIGVGVESAFEPTVYSLHGYSFLVAFPGTPRAATSVRSWTLSYESAPPRRTEAVYAQPTNLQPSTYDVTLIPVDSALAVAIDRKLADIASHRHLPDMPPTAEGGTWNLPDVAGFQRFVLAGPLDNCCRDGGPFHTWWGEEILVSGQVEFELEVFAPSYEPVRAFLDSFVPLS